MAIKHRRGATSARTASDSDEFALDEFMPYRLAVTAGRVTRLFARRYADEFGLSIPEWRVLTIVAREADVSPSVVSARARMDKVKVSRATASLVSRGLLKQAQDPRDGRARRLRLTKRGQSTLESIVPVAREMEARLADGLSRTEWQTLRGTLSKLDTLIGDGESEVEFD